MAPETKIDAVLQHQRLHNAAEHIVHTLAHHVGTDGAASGTAVEGTVARQHDPRSASTVNLFQVVNDEVVLV